MNETPPPSDPVAESSVMSILINYPDCIASTQNYLYPKDFYHIPYGKVYECLLELFEDTSKIDIVTLRDKLEAKGYLDLVGNEAGLAMMTSADNYVSSLHIIKYAKIVKEHSIRRQMAILGERLMMNCKNKEKPLVDSMDSFDAAFNETEQEYARCFREEGMSFGKAMEEVLTRRTGELKGPPCGIPFVDNVTLSLKRDHLWVVYASSGAGKTFAGLQMAMSVLKAGGSVRFLSLEMSSEEIWDRLILMEQNGDRSDTTAFDRAQAWKLVVDDTMFSMSKIRRYMKQHSAETDVFIVDYLGLIESGETKSGEIENIILASRDLQKCAKKYDTCVVALAQDNTDTRDADQYDVTIKGGASVRAVADVIIKLRRYIDFPDDPMLKTERVKVWLQKNRHGRSFYMREYLVNQKTGAIDFSKELNMTLKK